MPPGATIDALDAATTVACGGDAFGNSDCALTAADQARDTANRNDSCVSAGRDRDAVAVMGCIAVDCIRSDARAQPSSCTEGAAVASARASSHSTCYHRGPVSVAPSRVLVVEDDPDIADLMRRYLLKSGFDVDVCGSGRDALRAITSRHPDLLVLDLMLPEVSGLEICRAIRSNDKTATIPIIMVTARAEESERIAGLDLGADDYLAKPFSPGELVARVKALLRRSARTPTVEPTISYGPLVVDTAQHTVSDGGQPVALTAKEFLLLQYVLRNRGRVLSRDVLLTDVWGYTYTGGTRTVDVHVRRLREKLPVLESALVTVKQFGYRLLESPPGVAVVD